VSDLFGLPLPFILLLSVSVAAGADLFLTLLVLGLSQELGWPGLQEPGLHSLHWGVLGSLAFLYLLEGVSELRPVPALLWHNLQLLLRPLGGVLLALTLLDGLPATHQLLGALAAGIVCAFTHVLTWGQKLLPFLAPDRKISIATRVLAEDTLVLAFLVLTTKRPDLGFAVTAPILLLGVLLGGPHHHVVRFGLLLMKGRVLSLLRPPGWRDELEIPYWIREKGENTGPSGLRGMPAGILGIPGVRGFREGWLLEEGDTRHFVFRRRGRPRSIPLESDSMGLEEEGSLALRVPLKKEERGRTALFLQKGSPNQESHK